MARLAWEQAPTPATVCFFFKFAPGRFSLFLIRPMGGMLAWELAPTPDIFYCFVCNLDEKLVTVSGEFYEKSVLVTTGPFYNSFSIIPKPAGWKF